MTRSAIWPAVWRLWAKKIFCTGALKYVPNWAVLKVPGLPSGLKPTDSTTYGAWPKCGEIDIMEQLNKDTFVYHTMHTEYIKVLGHKTDPDYYTTASYNPHEFNVFGMEWTPDKIDMFINDSLTFSYPRIQEEGSVQWPFDVPFFLLLNQILGGWAGEIGDTELPVQMEVDWVRYYELPENKNRL